MYFNLRSDLSNLTNDPQKLIFHYRLNEAVNTLDYTIFAVVLYSFFGTSPYGSWDTSSQKKSFVDKALSNFDHWAWCGRLNIPLKGIFARDKIFDKNHSPCVINLDSSEEELTGFDAGFITNTLNFLTRSGFHPLWNGKKT